VDSIAKDARGRAANRKPLIIRFDERGASPLSLPILSTRALSFIGAFYIGAKCR